MRLLKTDGRTDIQCSLWTSYTAYCTSVQCIVRVNLVYAGSRLENATIRKCISSQSRLTVSRNSLIYAYRTFPVVCTSCILATGLTAVHTGKEVSFIACSSHNTGRLVTALRTARYFIHICRSRNTMISRPTSAWHTLCQLDAICYLSYILRPCSSISCGYFWLTCWRKSWRKAITLIAAFVLFRSTVVWRRSEGKRECRFVFEIDWKVPVPMRTHHWILRGRTVDPAMLMEKIRALTRRVFSNDIVSNRRNCRDSIEWRSDTVYGLTNLILLYVRFHFYCFNSFN